MDISEIQSLFEMMSEPTTMEIKFFNIKTYILATGGGLYWILLYWTLYFFFAYEVIDIHNEIKFMSMILILFTIVGLVLTGGVIRHLRIIRGMFSTLDGQLKRHASDFASIVSDFKRNIPTMLKLTENFPDHKSTFDALSVLEKKFEAFEQTYFNREEK